MPAPAPWWDCHFHTFDARRYRLAPGSAYQPADAPLADFFRLCAARGIGHAVLVHPSVYGQDHASFEDALRAHPDRLRGVAVVQADEAITPDEAIARWHALGTRGARINRLFPGAPEAVGRVLDRLQPWGWHLQLLVDLVADWPLVRRVAARGVPVVLDHLGHHEPRALRRSPAWRNLLALAAEGSAWVKLSAPYRLDRGPAPWAGVRPLVDDLLRAAPQRLLWGSDWPHPPRPRHPFPAPDPAAVGATLQHWLPDAALREQVMARNPVALYGEPGPG